MMRFARLALVAVLLAATQPANAKAPMEAFGDLPEIRAMELSPDGKRAAFINRVDGVDYLAIYDFATGRTEALSSINDIRARYIKFVGNNYVVLIASKATRTWGYTARFDYSGAFAFNLSTKKVVQLLKDTDGLYAGQAGLGNIIGIDPDRKRVFMPVHIRHPGFQPSLDIMQVNLDTGRGTRMPKAGIGNSNTIDWIVNAKAEVVAREDFDNKDRVYDIAAYGSSGDRKIYSEKTQAPNMSIMGLSAKTGGLMIAAAQGSDFQSLYEMNSADGSLTPALQRKDAEIEEVIIDANRTVVGVRYSGMFPTYEMFDPALSEELKKIANSLAGTSVYLDSWSDDWSRILLLSSGGNQPERYIMLDRSAGKLAVVAAARPAITKTDVGEVITIDYIARDGLKIPGLITWPAGVPIERRKNLPLVVLPHGGPESYDSVSFDWLAQFFANEGYMVLQPNFRGSAGFGEKFAAAGYGQWGRKMQDDITDGVKAAVTMGWANPARTCIVGWSYGGYAALAGGALTPDLYKCVVSVAGVSDLRDMLAVERATWGEDSRIYTYWKKVIGDPDRDRAEIDAVSPARLADRFKAPVLLIHGSDDTTVDSDQSDRMENALKAAKKDVTYIHIKGDDHGLVENESRRTVLTAIANFLTQHTGKSE